MTDSKGIGADRVSRRRTLKGIGVGASLAAMGGAGFDSVAATQEKGTDPNPPVKQWPQYSYNAANTAHGRPGGPRKDAALKWDKDPSARVKGPLVVKDGRVYYCNDDHETIALDEQTGKEIWRYTNAGNDYWGVTAYKDTVYFSDRRPSDQPGGLYALDAKTGELRWKNEGRGEGISSGVTVANDTLYYGSPVSNSEDGRVYAVNPETSEELWTYRFRSDNSSWNHAWPFWNPAVADGKLFVGCHQNNDWDKVALDAETGEELWVNGAGAAGGAVAVADGIAIFPARLAYHAHDAETGEILWSFNKDDKVLWTSPAIADGTAYLGTRKSLYAADLETGRGIWEATSGQVEHDYNAGATQSSPAMTRGIVYTGPWAFDAETGEGIWRFPEGNQTSDPAVANGSVYYGGDRIVALEEKQPT